MLGWLLLGLLATAVVVVVISGTITKNRIREEMKKQNIGKAILRQVNSCTNVVKLEDLESGKTLEIQGDGVASELVRDERIYV